jgi:tetratricopeptide (TPR) repeat protein
VICILGTTSLTCSVSRDGGRKGHERRINYYKVFATFHDLLGMDRWVAVDHFELGMAYEGLYQHDRAIEHFNLSLAVSRKRENSKGMGMALARICWIYWQTGRPDSTLTYGQEAILHLRQVGFTAELLGVLEGMGRAHTDLGDYDRALEFFEEGLEISNDMGYPVSAVRFHQAMGRMLAERGDSTQALEHLEEAVKTGRVRCSEATMGYVLADLGIVLARMGRHGEAHRHLDQSLTIFTQIHSAGKALSLYGLGLVYSDTGEFEEALNCFETALEIDRDIDFRRGVADDLLGIARLLAKNGRLQDARHYYGDALEVLKLMGATHRVKAVAEEMMDYSCQVDNPSES